MRISDKSTTNRIQSGIQKNRNDISNLQTQASSMKRITKPSDDPVGTLKTQAARTDRYIGEQYQKNLNIAQSYLNSSEQALSDVGESLVRLKELVLGQVNDASANALTRRASAVEVDQLFKNVVNVANRKFGERFLFGGFQTTSSPFDSAGKYHGDDGEVSIEVNKGVYVPVNLTGREVFIGKDEDANIPPWKKNVDDALNVDKPLIRGPASSEKTTEVRMDKGLKSPEMEGKENQPSKEVNIFQVLKKVGIGLRANDKATVQDAVDEIDQAIDQIILARSKLGARVMSTQSTLEAITKGNVDAKVIESNNEDADAFELFSDMKKAQTTLEATLSTSGKMIQPSLLDFLK